MHKVEGLLYCTEAPCIKALHTEALHEALRTKALHKALRTEALHEALYTEALHDGSAYDGSTTEGGYKSARPR